MNLSQPQWIFGVILSLGAAWVVGCVETPATGPTPPPAVGSSEFESAPPAGTSGTRATNETSGAADAGAAPAPSGSGATTSTARAVEETDIYRLDGERLYYLNGYRGLMVFDVHDVDSPRLLGRVPLYGYPVEMVVRNGVASAIMSDWYGMDSTGRAFHGSVVRASDARDTSNLPVISEIALGDWVRDSRVVGDVLYTIAEEWGGYGYYDDEVTSSASRGRVVINSIDFSTPGVLRRAGERAFDGYSGVFNVTADAILMAHTNETTYPAIAQSSIDYVDISDPHGAIRVRGSATIDGSIQGWGANNGRFNIDFDGRYVRALAQRYDYSGTTGASYVLHTLDAQDPDHLAVTSRFEIPTASWAPAARFDRGRMYLSPSGYWTPTEAGLPIQIYDVSTPASPRLAGETYVTGNVWNFIPAGDRLFAIGNEYSATPGPYGYYDSSRVSVRYLDVSDASHPRVLGTSTFGEGWAWTPAAGDFKAFTMDATRNLVVLPFSGWNNTGRGYVNGLQLIEFNRDSMSTAGVARTRGWTERGIFVGTRLLSLSDLSLSVIDYSNRASPRVVNELTLARNIVAAHPMGDSIVEVSSDWWGHDTGSAVRVVPASDPDDEHLTPALSEVQLEGSSARVYHNGNFAYVATIVDRSVPCSAATPGSTCTVPERRITVVDVSNPRAARVRGTITLPTPETAEGFYGYYGGWYGGWGWWGWYGWWEGESIVQVAPDLIAVRDSVPGYYAVDAAGEASDMARPTPLPQLHLINLANPDAPARSSLAVTPSRGSWWGNIRVSNGTLFVTHYDWLDRAGDHPRVRYFLDRVDVSDRANPRIAERINVPGFFVGASPDARTIYTINYRWESVSEGGVETYRARNTFNALSVSGGRAYLQDSIDIDGWMGQVFVSGSRAYFSTENSSSTGGVYRSSVAMHALDLTNPRSIIDRASASTRGWGWLLGIAGDRAVVSSGWGSGVNVYRLSDESAPVLVDFVRTHGWWGSNLDRQGDTMYLASGYYGVQTISAGR